MLSNYATDELIITPQTKDKWGELTPGDPVTYQCRHEGGNKLVTDRGGQQVTSTGYVDVGPSVQVSYDDKVELNGVKRTVIMIETLKDFSIRGYRLWLA